MAVLSNIQTSIWCTYFVYDVLYLSSEIPIYVQLRNQIVMGIAKGQLRAGESLPTVRRMAADAGINTMTVNKAYQLLKAEGYIEIDRRHGAAVKGLPKEDFLSLCSHIFDEFSGCSKKYTQPREG